MAAPASPVGRIATALVVFVATVLLATSALAIATLLGEVIGAKNSKVYHLYPEECGTAKRINAENIIRFASADEAERAGRRLCKACETLRAKRELNDGKLTGEPARSNKKGENSSHPPPASQPFTGGVPSGSGVPQFARVTAVLPGGTVELDIGEKVRLFGVACPAEGQALANETVRFIDEQTRGRTVRLSQDPEAADAAPRDSLGRLAVYLTPQPDGRDLGGELIFQGFAWVDREARFDRRAEYARHEEAAWRDHRGIWKPLSGEAGKREVVTGRFAPYYHDAKCPHVPHLTGVVKMTVNEAKNRRLLPCPLYRVREKQGG